VRKGGQYSKVIHLSLIQVPSTGGLNYLWQVPFSSTDCPSNQHLTSRRLKRDAVCHILNGNSGICYVHSLRSCAGEFFIHGSHRYRDKGMRWTNLLQRHHIQRLFPPNLGAQRHWMPSAKSFCDDCSLTFRQTSKS